MNRADAVRLPDAPPLPGLSFRPFRDEGDFAAMAAVIAACQERDRVDPLSPAAGIPTVAELAESFSAAENIDLRRDLLLATLDGQVIGFQWVRWWTQADGTRVYYHRGRVVPAWRGRGIGTAMLRWAERHSRALAAQAGGPAVLQANTTIHEQDYNRLLLAEGYTPVHSFIELAYDSASPPPETPLPPGFERRPALPEHYRAIWEANEEAFADEWGRRAHDPVAFLKFLASLLTNPRFDPDLWQVAWHGDEVAGVALCEITARGVGEITDLSVRARWRGRGLGRALLAAAVRALKARGLAHIRVFTDADDPFGVRALYERAGFRVAAEYLRYRKPLE
ncbi:MAG: GNAT family N-acetyltransferase [Aggregatilineales bacterium]